MRIHSPFLISLSKHLPLQGACWSASSFKCSVEGGARLLDDPEHRRLVALFRAGGKAGQRAFVGLFEDFAKRIDRAVARHGKGRAVDLEVLRSGGREGLLLAAREFPLNGTDPFASWASTRINSGVRDAKLANLGIGTHLYGQVNQAKAVQETLFQQRGHEPSYEQIGQQMGLPAERVKDLLERSQHIYEGDYPLSGFASNAEGSAEHPSGNSREPAAQELSTERKAVVNLCAKVLLEALIRLPDSDSGQAWLEIIELAQPMRERRIQNRKRAIRNHVKYHLMNRCPAGCYCCALEAHMEPGWTLLRIRQEIQGG